MATKTINAQFVGFLIEEYKALPSLWEVDSDAYKNKHIKRADYNSLLNTMMAVDPLLTMDELKKKIAKIRTCYRRELKKVSESIKSGTKGDDVYIPTLWYFDQLDFLRGQDQEPRAPELNQSTVNNADNDDVDEVEWKPVVRNFKIKTRSSKQFKKSFVKRNTFLNKPIKCPEPIPDQNQTKKDEATIFSETWVVLFRKLSHEQQLFGKRCIDEVLYQGQLGKLNPSSYRNIEINLRGSPDSKRSTSDQDHVTDEGMRSSNCKFDVDNEKTPSFSEL